MNMDACLLVVKDNEQLTLKGLTEHKLKNVNSRNLTFTSRHLIMSMRVLE